MDQVQEDELGNTSVTLKHKERQIVSPENNINLNVWDSNGSDTESLAEERAYQEALLKRIDGLVEDKQTKDKDPDVLKQVEKQHLDYTEQGEEYLDVCDSLEIASDRTDHRSDDSELTRDRYSDLRYDPNWRSNLREARKFSLPQNTDESSEEIQSDREGRSARGGYSYAIVRNLVLSENVTPDMMGDCLAAQHHLESYHLHPLERKSTSEEPPLSANHLHEPSNRLHEPSNHLHEPSNHLHEPSNHLHEPSNHLHEPSNRLHGRSNHSVTNSPRKSTHLPTNRSSQGDGSRNEHRNDRVRHAGLDSTHQGLNPHRSPRLRQDRGTQEGVTQDRGTQDRGTQDRGTQDRGTQEGGTQHRGTQDRGTQDRGTQDRATQEGGTQHRGTQDRGTQDRGTQEGGTQHRGTQDRGTQDRGTQDRGTQDRATQEGGTQDRGTQDRGTQDRGTQDGGTQDGGTQDRGTQDRGTQDRGTQESGTLDTGTQDRHGPGFQTSSLVQWDTQAGGTESDEQQPQAGSLRQKAPQKVSKRKTEKPKDDIIERNRTTLGIQATKRGGSYLKAHSLKGDQSDTSSQVTETSDELTTAGSQEGGLEDSLDPELRWLQQAQRLRVTQKKGQWRRNPPEKRPGAPGGQARQGDCLSPTTSEPTARPQLQPHPGPQLQPYPWPKLQPHPLFPQPSHPPPPSISDTDSTFSSTSSSHPGIHLQPSPSVHLHINLHSSSDLPPLLHHSKLDLTSSSHPHASLLFPYHGVTLAPSPGPLSSPALVPPPKLGVQARPSPSGVGMAPEPAVWSIWSQGDSPAGWPGNSSTRWRLSPPDHHVESSTLHPADSNSRPAVCKQQPGPSAVLPPIGPQTPGHTAGGQGNSNKTSVQRSSSDSYLAHLEKQRHLKERLTYKAYTLKDYQRLKQDLKLGGLGPVYTLDDVTVEKMRRQKLYSNVIREQNKMRNRLPVLPARKPAGQDKEHKDIPRKKALEYAKSIPRPVPPSKPPSMPREGERGEGVSPDQGYPYLEGLDLSQLATLDLLRKRHEEEKAAVAHLKMLHAV